MEGLAVGGQMVILGEESTDTAVRQHQDPRDLHIKTLLGKLMVLDAWVLTQIAPHTQHDDLIAHLALKVEGFGVGHVLSVQENMVGGQVQLVLQQVL